MNKREEEILTTFSQIPYMNFEQIMGLGIYSANSEKSVKTLLKRFHEASLLLREKRDNYPNAPYYYWLGAAGRKVLHGKGFDFSTWAYSSDMKDFVSSQNFPHYIGSIQFLVAIKALKSMYPQIAFKTFMDDLEAHRKWIRKSNSDYNPPIPDGWVVFGSGDKPALWEEWDTGKESDDQILAKTQQICYLMKNHWETFAKIPIENTTFCFINTKSEQRSLDLMRIVQNELYHQSFKRYAGHFKFLYWDKNMDVQSVFFNPIWETPYSGKTSLLEVQ